MQNKQSLSSQLLSCGDVESNPGPNHIKTSRETSGWLKHLNSQNLTMRENLEEAIVFCGSFRGDHRAFVTWQDNFIQKQKRMKFEAQRRIRRDVGGSGKQFYTPPMDVTFYNIHGFCHGTMAKTTTWQNPCTMTFAIVYDFCHTSMVKPMGYPIPA